VRKFDEGDLEKLTILDELNSVLSCDDKLSAKIYYNFINTIEQLNEAKKNIELLIKNKVSLEFIKENIVLLTLPLEQIKDNLEIIKTMNPRSIEDFLPLVEVDTSELKAIRYNVNKRQSEHPIYVFSKKLKLQPNIVAKYFAKHSDVFFGDFNLLKSKLDLLVAYNVRPLSIIKSPNTFAMSTEKLERLLKELSSEGIKTISAWVLYSEESRLKTFVARQIEEKETLGESSTTLDYLADRLNWDETAKVKAVKYYPPLGKCSVLKVKRHLDYLLNETHFTIADISSNVSIFKTKLDELKLRMNELNAIGITPTKLYQICLAKKNYLEMIGKFCKKNESQKTFDLFKSIEKRIKNAQR